MRVEIIKDYTGKRVPKKFLAEKVMRTSKILHQRGFELKPNLVLAFIDEKAIKKLNYRYRLKNKATDILSFESADPDCLGELVLCSEVIEQQAYDQTHSFRDELLFMTIHGILHLLGFEHEGVSIEKAKEMFDLQEELFKRVR